MSPRELDLLLALARHAEDPDEALELLAKAHPDQDWPGLFYGRCRTCRDLLDRWDARCPTCRPYRSRAKGSLDLSRCESVLKQVYGPAIQATLTQSQALLARLGRKDRSDAAR